jgi:hypothetical protein
VIPEIWVQIPSEVKRAVKPRAVLGEGNRCDVEEA